jgi:hypothetical protein
MNNPTHYIEEFDIPGVGNLGIERGYGNNGKFYCRVNGCGIGGSKTLPGARVILFEHSREELKRRLNKAQAEVSLLENSIGQLLDDPFNLGQFKKKS